MTVVPCQNIGLGSTHTLDSRYTRVRNVRSGPKSRRNTFSTSRRVSYGLYTYSGRVNICSESDRNVDQFENMAVLIDLEFQWLPPRGY